MGCFLCNIFKGNDINIGIEEYKNTPGAKLIDVRTREEYSSGHIPGSVNIPLQVTSEGSQWGRVSGDGSFDSFF